MEQDILLRESKVAGQRLIKKKYRELVKKYHPDFIQSKGHDASSVEFDKQKMQERHGESRFDILYRANF